jgi:hypothetical protein
MIRHIHLPSHWFHAYYRTKFPLTITSPFYSNSTVHCDFSSCPHMSSKSSHFKFGPLCQPHFDEKSSFWQWDKKYRERTPIGQMSCTNKIFNVHDQTAVYIPWIAPSQIFYHFLKWGPSLWNTLYILSRLFLCINCSTFSRTLPLQNHQRPSMNEGSNTKQ